MVVENNSSEGKELNRFHYQNYSTIYIFAPTFDMTINLFSSVRYQTKSNVPFSIRYSRPKYLLL